LLLNGDGGWPFSTSANEHGRTYVADYYAFGFTTVQFAWSSAWNDNVADPNVKSVKDEAWPPRDPAEVHQRPLGEPLEWRKVRAGA